MGGGSPPEDPERNPDRGPPGGPKRDRDSKRSPIVKRIPQLPDMLHRGDYFLRGWNACRP